MYGFHLPLLLSYQLVQRYHVFQEDPEINKRMNLWMNEWMNEWMKERMNEGMNEWTNERMNEWMNEWLDEWMNEWTNEWMNGWQKWKYTVSLPVNQKWSNTLLNDSCFILIWKAISIKGWVALGRVCVEKVSNVLCRNISVLPRSDENFG